MQDLIAYSMEKGFIKPPLQEEINGCSLEYRAYISGKQEVYLKDMDRLVESSKRLVQEIEWIRNKQPLTAQDRVLLNIKAGEVMSIIQAIKYNQEKWQSIKINLT